MPTGQELSIVKAVRDPYGAYVFATAGTGAVVASTAFQSNLDATGTLTVTAKPPASLGSGIYADSVQIKICFDSACTKPALHTPFTLPITYIVDASPGVDSGDHSAADQRHGVELGQSANLCDGEFRYRRDQGIVDRRQSSDRYPICGRTDLFEHGIRL